jgi:hypothetical protein
MVQLTATVPSAESVSRIFFECILTKFIWSGIRKMFGVQWNLTSFFEFFHIITPLSPGLKCMIWLLFAAQSWTL